MNSLSLHFPYIKMVSYFIISHWKMFLNGNKPYDSSEEYENYYQHKQPMNNMGGKTLYPKENL